MQACMILQRIRIFTEADWWGGGRKSMQRHCTYGLAFPTLETNSTHGW
jgi:hypothetical protein